MKTRGGGGWAAKRGTVKMIGRENTPDTNCSSCGNMVT